MYNMIDSYLSLKRCHNWQIPYMQALKIDCIEMILLYLADD